MQADWTSICAETDSTLQPVFSGSEERGSEERRGWRLRFRRRGAVRQVFAQPGLQRPIEAPGFLFLIFFFCVGVLFFFLTLAHGGVRVS